MVGALPPRDVYSANIRNASGGPVAIKITYGMPFGGADVVAAFDVADGVTQYAAQKTVEKDGATFTGFISKVEVSNEGGLLCEANAPFNVNSPTKDYALTIVHVDGKYAVEEK